MRTVPPIEAHNADRQKNPLVSAAADADQAD
jgi:hypothetical protein